MSNGVFGTKRGADVNPSDIEIFMHYSPDRNTYNTEIIKLTTEDILMTNINPNNKTGNEILPGMYTLKLPKDYFSAKGFYTLLIKPLEIRTKIVDVGYLSAQPSIRGVVLDTNSISQELRNRFENSSLIGYRIEYLNKENSDSPKMNNLFRIITSNNKSEPVNQNLTDSAQKAIRYRFNDSGTLIFCTVTPNSSGSTKPNIIPFIGTVDQDIILSNTFFDPVMLEIEMVDYDMEDMAIGLFGNQTKSLEDGIYTLYDFQNEIYKQYNIYETKDTYSDTPQFEIKEEREEIDTSKDFDNITE